MARYRKVEVSVWSDRRFMAMTPAPPSAQTLWLYLLCGPRTTSFPGLVVGREEVMASDLGWSVEAFREAFREVSAQALAKGDWKVGLVVLSKALLDSSGEPRDTAKPASPNVLKSWSKSWSEIPECHLKHQYLQTLESFAKGLGEAFLKAFREAFRKALANPYPDPSPNQEQDTGTGTEAGGSGESPPSEVTPTKPRRSKTSPPLAAMQAAGRLLTHVVKNNPGSTTAKATTERQGQIIVQWADHIRRLHEIDGHSYDEIERAIDWVAQDSFWSGTCQSGDNLRRNWNTISAQMQRGSLRVVRGGGGEQLAHLERMANEAP